MRRKIESLRTMAVGIFSFILFLIVRTLTATSNEDQAVIPKNRTERGVLIALTTGLIVGGILGSGVGYSVGARNAEDGWDNKYLKLKCNNHKLSKRTG